MQSRIVNTRGRPESIVTTGAMEHTHPFKSIGATAWSKNKKQSMTGRVSRHRGVCALLRRHDPVATRQARQFELNTAIKTSYVGACSAYPVCCRSWCHQALGNTNIVLGNSQTQEGLHSQGLLMGNAKEFAHDKRR